MVFTLSGVLVLKQNRWFQFHLDTQLFFSNQNKLYSESDHLPTSGSKSLSLLIKLCKSGKPVPCGEGNS